MRIVKLSAAVLIFLFCAAAAWGQLPVGWKNISSGNSPYSGITDGLYPYDQNIIVGRENSYAWSLAVCGGNLWVGTQRDVGGLILATSGLMNSLPAEFPPVTDIRARLFKAPLQNNAVPDAPQWSLAYTSPAIPPSPKLPGVTMGMELGYRMMRCMPATGSTPETLYLGGAEPRAASMLAVDADGSVKQLFTAVAAANNQDKVVSIRAMIQHAGKIYWAAEYQGNPAIWFSADPLGDWKVRNAANPFKDSRDPTRIVPVGTRIDIPLAALGLPTGTDASGKQLSGEIIDMISYNNAIYVFFLTYETDTDADGNIVEHGFICAKLTVNADGTAKAWKPIVSDVAAAPYKRGMGRYKNAGAVPIVFNNKVYVGTIEGAPFRTIAGFPPSAAAMQSNPLAFFGYTGGMQIFRFGTDDKWERVMPSKSITNASAAELASGFANPLNKYIWRFGIQKDSTGKDVLYAGTFDAGTAIQVVADSLGQSITLPTPGGFDLYYTTTGDTWFKASNNGFNDQYNYGVRTFVTDPSNNLILGTANPFYGLQIWKKAAPKPPTSR